MTSAIRALGFDGYHEFEEAARHVFIYERTADGTYRPSLLIGSFQTDPDDDDT